MAAIAQRNAWNTRQDQPALKCIATVGPPLLALEAKLPAQPEDNRRQQRPFVPVTQRPIQRLAPTDRMPDRRRGKINLRGEKKPNPRRKKENPLVRSRNCGAPKTSPAW
jgi:hypothetical protein